MALNEQAFLQMMNGIQAKPAFNDHVQGKTKPAPASKAAAIIAQPAKTTKSSTSTTKSVTAFGKSPDTAEEAFRKMGPRNANKSPNGDGNIRLAPTHEFAFPPPITRSGGKNAHGSGVSVHTDGVESAATFDSADFETQGSGDAQSTLDMKRRTIVIGSKSKEENGAAKAEAQSGSSLGIRVLPPANHVDPQRKDDLITLDEGGEQSNAVGNLFISEALSTTNTNSMPSPAIPDIMDEDLDTDVPQTSLTPKSSVAPRSITYRGARYVRADQMTGQDIELLLQATRPGAQMGVSSFGANDRVAVTTGLNIGLRRLQESSGSSILGEHNLPGRGRGSTEASSTPSLVDSMWASEKVRFAAFKARPAPLIADPNDPIKSETTNKKAGLQQPPQHDHSSRKAQKDDTEMTGLFDEPTGRRKFKSSSGLTASKYATVVANNAMKKPMASVGDANLTASARTSFAGLHKDTQLPRPAPQSREVKSATDLQLSDDIRKPHFASPSKTGSSQVDKGYLKAVNHPTTIRKSARKAPDLSASMWASSDSESMFSGASKRGLHNENHISSHHSGSGGDTIGKVDLAKSQNEERRKRNPFSAFELPSKSPSVGSDSKFSSTFAAQPAKFPTMIQRSGNVPIASQTLPARPFSFNFCESPVSKSASSLRTKPSSARAEVQASGLPTRQGSHKPKIDPMASRNPYDILSSPGEVRLRSRLDSSSDESEI